MHVSRLAVSRYRVGKSGSSRLIKRMLSSTCHFYVDLYFVSNIRSYLSTCPNRLIPFVVVVLLLEEVIPLIVLYAPFMLPSTCMLPAQRERVERKRRESQQVYALTMQEEFDAISKATALSVLSRNQLVAMCGYVEPAFSSRLY